MSRTLIAEELVFTTLSARHSPLGKGGYQIAYASPGLTEEDRQAIQQWVGSFRGAQGEPPRWQFFRLPDGRSVVTRTQAIPADAEISDRRGGYLAYALVIPAAEFALVGSDPFRVLDAISYPMTAGEVIARYGLASGAAPKVEVKPGPVDGETSLWTGQALRDMLSLTLNAGELAAARRTVLVYGSVQARLDALRLALRIAPQAERVACSFDSDGDLNLARTGGLWAVGMSDRPREAAPHPLVDAGARQVIGEFPPIPTHSRKSLYGQWFEHVTPQDGNVKKFRATTALRVETLAATIESGAPLPAELELDSELCNDLCDIWRKEVRTAVSRRLLDFTSATIADGFSPWLQDRMTGLELFETAVGGAMVNCQISSRLAQWLLETTPKLGRREWERIGEIAAQSSSPLLTVLASILGREGDKIAREAAFSQLGQSDFAALLPLCLARIPPSNLVSGSHTHALIKWAADNPITEDALVDLVEALVASGAGNDLSPLTRRILQMSDRTLRRLDLWLEEHPRLPCSFRGAINERAVVAGSARPWWQRVIPGRQRAKKDFFL